MVAQTSVVAAQTLAIQIDPSEIDDADWHRRPEVVLGGRADPDSLPFPGWWLVVDSDLCAATLSPGLAADVGTR